MATWPRNGQSQEQPSRWVAHILNTPPRHSTRLLLYPIPPCFEVGQRFRDASSPGLPWALFSIFFVAQHTKGLKSSQTAVDLGDLTGGTMLMVRSSPESNWQVAATRTKEARCGYVTQKRPESGATLEVGRSYTLQITTHHHTSTLQITTHHHTIKLREHHPPTAGASSPPAGPIAQSPPSCSRRRRRRKSRS